MDLWLLCVLCTLGVIVGLYVVFGLSFAVWVDRAVFGKRQDKNVLYRYFLPEEVGLNGEDFPVVCGRTTLDGRLYYNGNLSSIPVLAIFVHGFGAGTASYTTEIASLVKQGCAVLAYDAYGCNKSRGSGIKGFAMGTECAVSAFNAACSDIRLMGKKKVFVGHSWGAYSALCALKWARADGVVALSAFDSPVRAIVDAAGLAGGKVLKELAALASPWFYLINFLKFGAKGNIRASSAAERSGVKCLVIHGKRDITVPLADSAAMHMRTPNVIVRLFDDKGHNPYNTTEAERILQSLFSSEFESNEERLTFYRRFDWTAATREDDEVMGQIYQFIDGLII